MENALLKVTMTYCTYIPREQTNTKPRGQPQTEKSLFSQASVTWLYIAQGSGVGVIEGKILPYFPIYFDPASWSSIHWPHMDGKYST